MKTEKTTKKFKLKSKKKNSKRRRLENWYDVLF